MKESATEKSCSSCRKAGRPHVKPLGDFSPDKFAATGRRAACKECEAQRAERRRERLDGHVADVTPLPEFDIDVVEPMRETAQTVELPHKAIRPLELDTSGPPLPRAGLRRVLAIPDLHLPFHSHRGVRLLLELAAKLQPDVIVQLGDLYDLLALSKFPRSFNVFTPRDEIDEARRWAVWLWRSLREAVPQAKCYQLRGNHDDRAHKRVMEVLPAIEHLVEPAIRALFEFEGVVTLQDSTQELELDGVLYHHGHRNFGQHVAWNLRPTVNGHLHRGGVIYKQTETGAIWELNAGMLADPTAPGLSYSAQKRMHGMTLGCGIVDEFGPRFVPF